MDQEKAKKIIDRTYNDIINVNEKFKVKFHTNVYPRQRKNNWEPLAIDQSVCWLCHKDISSTEECWYDDKMRVEIRYILKLNSSIDWNSEENRSFFNTPRVKTPVVKYQKFVLLLDSYYIHFNNTEKEKYHPFDPKNQFQAWYNITKFEYPLKQARCIERKELRDLDNWCLFANADIFKL